MILKNRKGAEKNFEVLLEIDKNGKKYLIYKDPYTGNVYGGNLVDDTLKVLDEKEFEFINEIIPA